MARNEEKAHSMMSKWTTLKQRSLLGNAQPKRPYTSKLGKSIAECEMWRRDIIKEIKQKLTQIQNKNLAPSAIKDLNDDINRLLRVKGHWERQIRSLGGPNYAAKIIEEDTLDPGLKTSDNSGYRYFGAARDLPDVQALYEENKAAQSVHIKTRHDLYQYITPDYYGYRDEEDGMLIMAEAEAELRAIRDEEEKWKQQHIQE
ncbi:hypothetical protein WA158_007545 [Blastocystis sp. Blastoise]